MDLNMFAGDIKHMHDTCVHGASYLCWAIGEYSCVFNSRFFDIYSMEQMLLLLGPKFLIHF